MQRTIAGCERVVSLDQVRALRRALKEPEQTVERLLEAIEELGAIPFTSGLLQRTRAGRELRRLKEHQNRQVRRAAKALAARWMELLLADPPERTVLPPPPPPSREARVRSSALGALGARAGMDEAAAAAMEAAIFEASNGDVGRPFARRLAAVIAALDVQGAPPVAAAAAFVAAAS